MKNIDNRISPTDRASRQIHTDWKAILDLGFVLVLLARLRNRPVPVRMDRSIAGIVPLRHRADFALTGLSLGMEREIRHGDLALRAGIVDEFTYFEREALDLPRAALVDLLPFA
jgi:hypothetical protein